MHIFDRASQSLLASAYSTRDLRLLAVSCYLVACKWEGIPANSHFFSAEVAAGIVKLGVSIEDVKEMECKVLMCLGWEFPVIFPSECCLFLFQAHKLSNWDGKSPLGLSLNSWMKDLVQEICKVCLEGADFSADFSSHGFTAALGCFTLIGKAHEQHEMRRICRYFLPENTLQVVFEKALLISTGISNSINQNLAPKDASQPAGQTDGSAIPGFIQQVSANNTNNPPSSKIQETCDQSSSTASTQPSSATKPQTPAQRLQQRRKRPKAAQNTQKQSPRCSRSEAKIRPPSFRLRTKSDSAEVLELCCREYLDAQTQCEKEFEL